MIQRTFLRSTNTNDLRYLFWSLFVCQILSLSALHGPFLLSFIFSHAMVMRKVNHFSVNPHSVLVTFIEHDNGDKIATKTKELQRFVSRAVEEKKEHTLPNYNWMQREKNGLDRKWACNFNLIRNTLESIDTENPSYMHTTWIVRYRVSEELRFPFHLFDSSFVSFRI